MLHHVEIYVSNLEHTRAFWGWLLCEELDYEIYQEWPQGISYRPSVGATGGAEFPYLVFVQTEEKHLVAGYHRCRTGLNHLAFRVQSPEQVDDLTTKLRAHGIIILYADRHPHAGGPQSYGVFFEDPDRIKVEITYPNRPRDY
ncbi:MAG: VOC family protein [bacterium]|nr:VOC family protein [bacterium]